MSINTLAAARTLEQTGMTEKQAEAVVEIVRQSEQDDRLIHIENHLGQMEAKINMSLALHLTQLAVLLGAVLAFFLNQ